MTLFTETGGTTLGMRIEGSGPHLDTLALPRAVHLAVQSDQIELFATDPEVFEPFYAFLLDVANRLQISGEAPEAAVTEALAAWRRMLAAPTLMGDDPQTGLLGELWILERLMLGMGTEAFDAWTGPKSEAHDFRLGDRRD